VLTDAELADLAGLVRSGQASLLRRVSGLTQETLAAEAGITVDAVSRSEKRRHVPQDDGVREAYYRALCTLRDRHGTVTLASAGQCERFSTGSGSPYRPVMPEYRRKRMPRRAA